MVPTKFRDIDVLRIWNKMIDKTRLLKRIAKAKFRVEHVRISIEKMEFSNGGEQNYISEIFKEIKFKCRWPRSVYELEDLRGQHIDGNSTRKN
jgi:hypothetical protein